MVSRYNKDGCTSTAPGNPNGGGRSIWWRRLGGGGTGGYKVGRCRLTVLKPVMKAPSMISAFETII